MGFAITADGALIITFEHRNTVAGDGFCALAIDLQQRVIFDVLFKVALGMQVDQFLAQSVFNVQFVVARAARGATAAQYTAGFVSGQRIGRRVEAIDQTTRNHRLVRITLQKRHQYFHADPWHGYCAMTVTGPARSHPQPATAGVVVLAFTVPMKLHLHPTVLIAMHLVVDGAGDPGGLQAQHLRLEMFEWRAVEHVPRCCREVVAIALGKPVSGLVVQISPGLFEHLRLSALMMDFSQQPHRVPVAVGVLAQGHEMATDKTAVVTFAIGHTAVGALALKGPLAQQLAALFEAEVARVAVIFKISLDALGVGAVARLDLATGGFEGVIAQGAAGGTGVDAHFEIADYRRLGNQAAFALIRHGMIEFGEGALAITEDQLMALG